MTEQNFMKEVGQRIRQRRRQMELTQEQLAERMDVSVQMISNLEQGKKAIRPENLAKLCRVLSASADFILLGACAQSVGDTLPAKYASLSPKQKQLLAQIIDSWLE